MRRARGSAGGDSAAGDRRFLWIAAGLLVWLLGEAALSTDFVLDDNRVEYVQVLALLLGVGCFVWRARVADAAYRPLLLGLAAIAMLLLLEEISWGQRLFGFATPAPLQAVNIQRETNLHNLHPLALLVPGALLIVIAVAALWWNRPLALRTGHVLVPHITRQKWLLMVLATLLVTVAMPGLAVLAGIQPADLARIFAYEHLWEHDHSALMDPRVWDRIGIDHRVATNLIRIYQANEAIEMLIYAFIANVAMTDPRDW